MNDRQARPPALEHVERLLQNGTFEETLGALERVVEHLERGRLSIDEAVNWYEAGLGLSRRCSDLLQRAELRVIDLEQLYGLAGRAEESWDADDR